MSFEKSACLATLLLSFPLVAPTLSVALDYDLHKDIDKTAGDAISSGTKDKLQTEKPAGTYEKVYIGHAQRNGTGEGKVQASYNKGVFSKDIILEAQGKIYGGSATISDTTSVELISDGQSTYW